jgi:hypothetical protein
VFNQLTKYLLQYKRVSIPNVGTILLVQQPPQLDVADKTIQPPTYTAELRDDETVSEHQLNFLSAIMRQEKESIHHSLNSLGLWLREKVRGNGFEWKGIGIIRAPGHPLSLPVGILETIPAQRVLRQDAEHSVLVGDQQLTSTQIAGRKAEEETARGTKRSIFVIVGWILLALSILYIIFVLYQGRFRIGATGSKASPTGYQRLQVDNKYTVTIAGL